MTSYLRTLAGPAETPVSVYQLREHCVDTQESDGYLDTLIRVSTEEAQHYTRRALVTQTLQYTLEQFQYQGHYGQWQGIPLPRTPVQSITQITYLDSQAARQVVDTDVYELHGDDQQACVSLAYDQTWPSAMVRPQSIQIDFVAGYGSIDAIPELIKQAILIRCGDRLEHRESELVGVSINKIKPNVFEYMLETFREYA